MRDENFSPGILRHGGLPWPLCEDETLLAQAFLHTGLTHSQTLLPMARDLLKACGLTPAQVDLIAVAAGPGSFTGLRIGVGHRQGLGLGGGEALRRLLYPGLHGPGTWRAFPAGVCGHGARRHQIYNARFQVDGTQPHRLTRTGHRLGGPVAELQGTQSPQLVVGDGAQLCYDALTAAGIPAKLAPPNLRLQSAWGWPGRGLPWPRQARPTRPDQLVPAYHRLSQAERERLAREQAAPAPQNQ